MARLGRSYTRRPKLVRAPDPYLFREGWNGVNGTGWPTDWTQSGPMATDIQSGAGRIVTGTTASASTAMRNTTALNSVDTNGVLRVKFTNVTNGGFFYFIHIRGSSTLTGTPLTLASSYELRLSWYNPNSSIGVNFYEIDGSGSKTYRNGADHLAGTIAAGDWVWLRWEVSGNPTSVLKYRIWKDGDTEPGTWTNDWSSSVVANYQGAYVGLIVQNGDTTSEDLAFDDLGILPAVASAPSMSGTLASTLDGATIAASGAAGASGTLASTLAGATIAVSGVESMSGALAATLTGATFAGAGSAGASGTLASTLDGATLAGAGVEQMAGTAASTLAGATSAVSGEVGYSGSLASTLDGASMAGAGAAGSSGSLASTLDGATIDASGTVTLASVTGTLASTLDDATIAGAGAAGGSGTWASTLDDATLAASGTVASDAATGTLASTLDGASIAAAGAEGFSGTLASTLDGATSAITGAAGADGDLAATLDGATIAVTAVVGADPITGTATSTLAGATIDVTAVQRRLLLVCPTDANASGDITMQEALNQKVTRAGRKLGRRFATTTRQLTVLKLDGEWVTRAGPTTADLTAATAYYLGGHLNYLNSAEAADLTSAGYTVTLETV